jgi:hypothetical protein
VCSEVPPYPLIQSSAAHDRRRALIVSLILLTTLAVLSAIGPLYRAQFLAEVDVNEGWNAYHVDAVLHGLPLYPSPDLLITNNYPPLYYYLVAGLSSIFGDTIFIGRALSFIAVLAVGAEIFLILRRLAVGQRPAFAAAVAYFATMCRLFDGRVAVNDPQLLAHAIVGLGLLLFALHLAFGAVLERANDIRPRALGTSAYQAVLIAATTARLLFGEPMDSFNVLTNPAIVQYFRDAEAAALADVERVRRIPGPVFCESPYTCFMAGKPFVVDGINLQFRVTMGREPCDVIDRLLESGEPTYVPSRTGSPNLRPYRFVLPLAYRLEENRENVTAPVSQISCGRRPAYKLQISFAAQDAIDQTPRR